MIDINSINWEKVDGLVPCIVQDTKTRTVLMMGYMNRESLKLTLNEKLLVFYSRTKKALWKKGETSGNYLKLIDLKLDCDQDTLLAFVEPVGPVCHKGTDTCWKETNEKSGIINRLEKIIQIRQEESLQTANSDSYVASLFRKGINKIAQKVGEEAVELVIESKDDNEELFLDEAADLLFHYLILLRVKGFEIADVELVLENREK